MWAPRIDSAHPSRELISFHGKWFKTKSVYIEMFVLVTFLVAEKKNWQKQLRSFFQLRDGEYSWSRRRWHDHGDMKQRATWRLLLRKQNVTNGGAHLPFSLFCPGPQSIGWCHPHLVSFPASTRLIYTLPHWPVQRFVSMVMLKAIKLTVKTADHAWILF